MLLLWRAQDDRQAEGSDVPGHVVTHLTARGWVSPTSGAQQVSVRSPPSHPPLMGRRGAGAGSAAHASQNTNELKSNATVGNRCFIHSICSNSWVEMILNSLS